MLDICSHMSQGAGGGVLDEDEEEEEEEELDDELDDDDSHIFSLQSMAIVHSGVDEYHVRQSSIVTLHTHTPGQSGYCRL